LDFDQVLKQDFSNKDIARLKFNLTTYCNFNCSYCYEGNVKEKNILNPMKAISLGKKVLDDLPKGEMLRVHYFGGEPFLEYKNMKMITQNLYIYAMNTGKQIQFGCTTNASILTDEILNHISLYPYFIGASCDGEPFYQNLNRKYKGGIDSAEKVIGNIFKIHERLGRIYISMVVTKNNVENLFNNVKYFIDRGINNFAIYVVTNNVDMHPDLNIYEQQLNKLVDLLNSIKDREIIINPPLWKVHQSKTRNLVKSEQSVEIQLYENEFIMFNETSPTGHKFTTNYQHITQDQIDKLTELENKYCLMIKK